MLALSVYLLYLWSGWMTLILGIKYPPAALRRELALNGVGDSPGDRFFSFLLASAYLFVLHIWPVAVRRKLLDGRVVGR